MFVEGDTLEFKSYVVERLLNKRSRRAGRDSKRRIIEYLVRWLGYGPAYNTWYNIKDLENCMDLVEEYEQDLSAITSLPYPAIDMPAITPLPSQPVRKKASATRPLLPASQALPEPSSAISSESHLPEPSTGSQRAIAVMIPTQARDQAKPASLTIEATPKPSPLTIEAPKPRLAIEAPTTNEANDG